jgi:hypothetical protein
LAFGSFSTISSQMLPTISASRSRTQTRHAAPSAMRGRIQSTQRGTKAAALSTGGLVRERNSNRNVASMGTSAVVARRTWLSA